MNDLQTTLIRHLGDLTTLATGEHEHVWLCSAYVSRDGVAAIDGLMSSAAASDSIFGAGPLTDPAALQSLHNRGSRIHLVPHDAAAEFHPKCYFGHRRDGQAWAAIGSANLTGGGVGRNVELLAKVTGPREHPFFAELTDWLEEVRGFSVPCTAELIEQVSYGWAQHRAARQELLREATDPWAAAFADADEPIPSAKGLAGRLHDAALLNYIRTTRVFASYKLVILALVLTAPGGTVLLGECARRFHAFYMNLHNAGRQPERATGSPKMRHPTAMTTTDVERLLMDEPRKAFANTEHVVVFARSDAGVQVSLASTLWATTTQLSRNIAYEAVLERLESYYETHTGSSDAIAAALRQATAPSH